MDKRGFISINNKIVCNRMGLTPEITVSSGDYIEINTKNAYTVSRMAPGIILSFYSVPIQEIKEKTIKTLEEYEITNLSQSDDVITRRCVSKSQSPLSSLIWFIEKGRAYFLSTTNKIDGFRSFWKGYPTFGEMLSKKYLMSLDNRYSWTFFLYHQHIIKYVLTTLWDIDKQIFITPEQWPKYLNPRKWERQEKNIWNVDDLSYLSAAKSTHFIFPDWVECHESNIVEKMSENVIRTSNRGIRVFSGEPLLITIYCADVLYTCKILVRQDLAINTILSRSKDKFECLLIAIFKEENVELFEKKYFTTDELARFYEKYTKAKKTFFRQIYEKVELGKYTSFPDKMFSALQLNRILTMNLSCNEKQEMAWKKLCDLSKVKNWKYTAISVFYNYYMM